MCRSASEQLNDSWPLLSGAVCQIRTKRYRFRPLNCRKFCVPQGKAMSDPADDRVHLIVVVEQPKLVPLTKAAGDFLGSYIVQERKTNASIDLVSSSLVRSSTWAMSARARV